MGTESPNVFIRLYRHRPQRHSTPKENFVTEAFALVLSMQPQLLRDFFHRFCEEDVPGDVRVETQVLVDGSCFDITVLNEKDFYFLIECKLDAGFSGEPNDELDQLGRYADELRRSAAPRKGLITLTARTPPKRNWRDIRLFTARWSDVLELCKATPSVTQSMADMLEGQFGDLLRFLKVDRGIGPNGRLLWRCDICGLETTGKGIHSHRQKHCREYAYLIDRDNDRLREEFEKKLEPCSAALITFNHDAKRIDKIERRNFSDRFKIIELLKQHEIPPNLWCRAASHFRCRFSNNAYAEFISELPTLSGVKQLTEPHYIEKTYENILTRISTPNTPQP